MDLSEDERRLLHKGLWEAMLQVKEERPGAMHALERMFDCALSDKRALVDVMRAYVDDAELRDREERTQR